MNMKDCKHCGISFDLESFAKRQAGGKINECPDCVEELGTETAVKYLGLGSGDGKAAAISIVAFESNEDRAAYASAWKDNTGIMEAMAAIYQAAIAPLVVGLCGMLATTQATQITKASLDISLTFEVLTFMLSGVILYI